MLYEIKITLMMDLLTEAQTDQTKKDRSRGATCTLRREKRLGNLKDLNLS